MSRAVGRTSAGVALAALLLAACGAPPTGIAYVNERYRSEADVARAQWALERAVVQPIPNINVMGGYQRQVGIPAMDQGLVQVMMAVPLFDRNQGNIRSARADIGRPSARSSSISPPGPPRRSPPTARRSGSSNGTRPTSCRRPARRCS